MRDVVCSVGWSNIQIRTGRMICSTKPCCLEGAALVWVVVSRYVLQDPKLHGPPWSPQPVTHACACLAGLLCGPLRPFLQLFHPRGIRAQVYTG